MNRKLFFILLTVVIAISMVWILNMKSLRPNSNNSGFYRNFSKFDIKEQTVIDNTDGVRNFCGSTEQLNYFSGKIPSHIFSINRSDSRIDEFELPHNKYINERTFSIFVDSPTIFTFIPNERLINEYNFVMNSLVQHKIPQFAYKMTYLGNGQFLQKIDDESRMNLLFSILDLKDSSDHHESQAIFPVLNDGGLINDGIMKYDAKSKKIVLVNYLNNSLISLNRDLSLAYRSRTIDTFSSMEIPINVQKFNNNTSFSFSKPVVTINKVMSIFNDRIYVNSLVKSDNESSNDFYSNSVVDVYVLNNGVYVGSFYIPLFERKPLVSFELLSDNVMVVIYESAIKMYSIIEKRYPS